MNMQEGRKGSIIGAVIVFVALMMLSVVMLVVGFVSNAVVPIYISISCGLLAPITLVILVVRSRRGQQRR